MCGLVRMGGEFWSDLCGASGSLAMLRVGWGRWVSRTPPLPRGGGLWKGKSLESEVYRLALSAKQSFRRTYAQIPVNERLTGLLGMWLCVRLCLFSISSLAEQEQ